MEFFVGTLTREGGGGVLRCDLDGAEISLKETLFLTDPNYVIFSGNRLFSVSSDAQGEFRGCVNEIDTSGVMRVLAQEETGGMGGLIVFLVVALLGGGGAFYYFKILKPKQEAKGGTDLDDFDFDEYDEDEPEADDLTADDEAEDDEV